MKRNQRQSPGRYTPPAEDRRGEAVTVAWMLSLVATLGAEIIGAGLRAIVFTSSSGSQSLLVLAGLMLFIAAITGLVCLMLTPLVHRLRRVPPPRPLTVFAVTTSVLPFAIGIIISLS